MIPDLKMRPVTHIEARMLVVQARHRDCACPVCEGVATLPELRAEERHLGIILPRGRHANASKKTS